MRLAITFLAVLLAMAVDPAAGRASPPRPRSFQDCPDCSTMIVIPAGHFTMGSPPEEPGRKDDEGPRTGVRVASFALAATDVTRAQWQAFLADTGRAEGLGCAHTNLPREQAASASWRNLGFEQAADEPVVCVSWNEAQAYIAWLSRRTGRSYRLPTEAEWEYAARAGAATAYPWGATASHDRANYGAETCCTPATGGADRWTYTSPVRAFPPNRFGLYDMIGNVWQWTADCYRPTIAGRPATAAAIDRPDCAYRVARGGTWGDTPALVRSASRNYAPPPGRAIPDYRSAGFGFRVASSDVRATRRAQ